MPYLKILAPICICLLFSPGDLTAEIKKHQRGTGLVPPTKTSGGAVIPSAAGSENGARKGTSPSDLHAKAPVDTGMNGAGEPHSPASASATKAAGCPKYSLDQLMKIPSAHSPQAAAGGGVFFLSDVSEVPQLYRLAAAGGSPEPLTSFPDGVSYFQASHSGDKVLVASQVGGDEQYDLYLVTLSPVKVIPLLVDRSKRVDSVAWGPDGTWFAFTSNQRNKTDFDLYRFELAVGKPQLLAELVGQNSVTDIAPDGKKITFSAFRSVTDGDVWVWEKRGLRNLTHLEGQAAAEGGMFSADSQGVFLTVDQPGARQLYYYALDPKRPAKRLTTERWDVENFSLDGARTSLAYLTDEDGYSRIRGWTIDARGVKGKNLNAPPLTHRVARPPSFSLGKAALFYSASSADEPSDIWRWSENHNEAWTHSRPEAVDPRCLRNETLVRYPSFDGKSIPAFVYRPNVESGISTPFVVYVHGGPESQYRPRFNSVFQYLLQSGVGVFAPNVRGSLGYGREFTLADNYKKRMDSVEDLLWGTRWLISQKYAKPGALALFGGSYGGFMVLRSLEMDNQLFAVASESVGITDFVTFLRNTKSYRRALREVEYGPLADEAFLKSISPMTYLDRLKTPLILFHGAGDPRVPVSESEQLVAALRKTNTPVEAKVFKDEGHGNLKLRNQIEQARAMIFFFEKYLNAQP